MNENKGRWAAIRGTVENLTVTNRAAAVHLLKQEIEAHGPRVGGTWDDDLYQMQCTYQHLTSFAELRPLMHPITALLPPEPA